MGQGFEVAVPRLVPARPGTPPRTASWSPGAEDRAGAEAALMGLGCKPKSLDFYLCALWAGEGHDQIRALWGSVWGESGGSKEASAPPVREELSTGSNQVSAVTAGEREEKPSAGAIHSQLRAAPVPTIQTQRKWAGGTYYLNKKNAKKKTSV